MDLFYCLCFSGDVIQHGHYSIVTNSCVPISVCLHSFVLRLFDHSRNFQYRFVDHTYTLLVITSWLAWFGWFLASKTKSYSQTIRRSLTSSTISKRGPRLCNLRICIFFALTWWWSSYKGFGFPKDFACSCWSSRPYLLYVKNTLKYFHYDRWMLLFTNLLFYNSSTG